MSNKYIAKTYSLTIERDGERLLFEVDPAELIDAVNVYEWLANKNRFDPDAITADQDDGLRLTIERRLEYIGEIPPEERRKTSSNYAAETIKYFSEYTNGGDLEDEEEEQDD